MAEARREYDATGVTLAEARAAAYGTPIASPERQAVGAARAARARAAQAYYRARRRSYAEIEQAEAARAAAENAEAAAGYDDDGGAPY